MARFITYSHSIIRAFLGLAMGALGVMMMTIVFDVFMRFAFNSPVTGSYDIVEICLAIAVFYSLGAVIIGAHEIVIDLIDQVAPPPFVTVLQRVAAFASAVVLIFMLVSMITPAMQSYQYGEIRLELNLPVWIVWTIALVGMSGGVLASIVNVLQPVKPSIRQDTP